MNDTFAKLTKVYTKIGLSFMLDNKIEKYENSLKEIKQSFDESEDNSNAENCSAQINDYEKSIRYLKNLKEKILKVCDEDY